MKKILSILLMTLILLFMIPIDNSHFPSEAATSHEQKTDDNEEEPDPYPG